jgi:predicted nucleic acid-binding protein
VLEKALQILRDAEAFMHQRDFPVDSASVLALAAASGCSAYDCEFVALAREFGLPLVTSDHMIVQQFPETAVSLQAFAA